MIPFYEMQPSDLSIIRNHRELYFKPHLHKHIEIAYIFRGGQYMEINNKSYRLKKGDAALIFPDQTHRYYRVEQRDTDEVLLICSTKMFGAAFPSFLNFVPKNPVIQAKDIPDDAVYAFSKLNPDNGFALNLGYTLIIISRLLECVPMDKTQHMPVEDITARIIEYIAGNFMNPLTLDVLAEEFHVSKYYISRIFSQKINMNFRNYIGALRAEYAANLLRTTDDSMTDICGKTGFDSQRSFNRIFRAIYNMSPREYRENINSYLKS